MFTSMYTTSSSSSYKVSTPQHDTSCNNTLSHTHPFSIHHNYKTYWNWSKTRQSCMSRNFQNPLWTGNLFLPFEFAHANFHISKIFDSDVFFCIKHCPEPYKLNIPCDYIPLWQHIHVPSRSVVTNTQASTGLPIHPIIMVYFELGGGIFA